MHGCHLLISVIGFDCRSEMGVGEVAFIGFPTPSLNIEKEADYESCSLSDETKSIHLIVSVKRLASRKLVSSLRLSPRLKAINCYGLWPDKGLQWKSIICFCFIQDLIRWKQDSSDNPYNLITLCDLKEGVMF
jgi:hypothetical protein